MAKIVVCPLFESFLPFFESAIADDAKGMETKSEVTIRGAMYFLSITETPVLWGSKPCFLVKFYQPTYLPENLNLLGIRCE